MIFKGLFQPKGFCDSAAFPVLQLPRAHRATHPWAGPRRCATNNVTGNFCWERFAAWAELPKPLSSGRASPQAWADLPPGSEQMMRKPGIEMPGTEPPAPHPGIAPFNSFKHNVVTTRTETLECPGHGFMGEALLTCTSQLSFHGLDLLGSERKKKKEKKNPLMMSRWSGCFISQGGWVRPCNCWKIYEVGIMLLCCWLMYLWCGCCESTFWDNM